MSDTTDTTVPEPTPPTTVYDFDPVSLVHPWCPADRPVPASYEAARAQDPDRCVAQDPCSGDGVTTLWTVQDCVAPVTTEVVTSVGVPPTLPTTLPATGYSYGGALLGAVVLLAGFALVIVGMTPKSKKKKEY